jgi:hypothetical protein
LQAGDGTVLVGMALEYPSMKGSGPLIPLGRRF